MPQPDMPQPDTPRPDMPQAAAPVAAPELEPAPESPLGAVLPEATSSGPPGATPSNVPVEAPDGPEPAPAPGPVPPAAVPVPAPPPLIAIPPVQDLRDWDEAALRLAVDPRPIRSRMRGTVEAMEALLDRSGGPGLLFDGDRDHEGDRAIRVQRINPAAPLWIVGDLHGDLLSLEAALAVVAAQSVDEPGARPRIVFLGDLFDDGGFGLETLLRVFELILDAPERICVVAGNHDEALSFDGARFASTVSPSDFADLLNAQLAHEWIERAGKVAVRLFAQAPRALFLPDGLLVSHGGFPLTDLHPRLGETGDWNDPACLADFVWTRAHPTARRKLPNRYSRGSQYGYEDFAAFCAVSAGLGRPVTHMVRGHDHVEERFAVYPAYRSHPVLTTVALSRRLPREMFGPRERAPTLARFVEGALPQVHRLHLPHGLIQDLYPDLAEVPAEPSSQEALA